MPSFLWRVTKIGLVLAFALQSGFYVANVADTANAPRHRRGDHIPAFRCAGCDRHVAVQPLDAFNDNASKQVADIMKDAGITRLDLFFAAGVFSVGTIAFLCVAVFVVTLATVFLTFVIGIGPIFVLCLAWKPTQRFFDSWLSMLLNAVVLTLVRLLCARPERVHRRPDVHGHSRQRWLHRFDASTCWAKPRATAC